VAVSLDGWTSGNNYGFLAIIVHYVNPNTGELGTLLIVILTISIADLSTEESLIDFRELLGKHTGENIADAVWDTLGTFGIQGKVNNGTLSIDGLTNS